MIDLEGSAANLVHDSTDLRNFQMKGPNILEWKLLDIHVDLQITIRLAVLR
jgi:hypothetical protein